jgi:hypothetical protein
MTENTIIVFNEGEGSWNRYRIIRVIRRTKGLREIKRSLVKGMAVPITPTE